MKKTIVILLLLCLCVYLCACDTSPTIAERATECIATIAEKAKECIDNGQLEEAYRLLYSVESRTEEEEALFARFSMIQIQKEIEHANGFVESETFNQYGYCTERFKTWSNGDWEKTTYTLDSEGRTLAYKTITSSGGWANGNNTFDRNGNVIASDRESDWHIQKIRITYDENGNKIKEVFEGGNKTTGTIKKVEEYKYDTAGNVIEKITTLNGTQYKDQYAYDAQGRRISYISYSGLEIKYTYDDEGRLLTETSYQNNEESSSHIYTYDDLGNLLTDVYKDSKGQEEQTSYAYTYDDYGNMIKMIITEPNGEKEITTITYQLFYN